jgi:osmoprotectant transport system permease protein
MPDPFVTGFLGIIGDAIDFIFTPQSTAFQTEKVGGIEQVLDLGGEHLKVTFLALGAALLLALPAGVLLGHYRRGEMAAITVGNAGRGIPELAVIALAAAFLGFGLEYVVAALMILGIPPILTNAYVGVTQVDRTAVEAARGVGMRDLEIIRKVELPLAVPTIMSGVRTGAINIVATAAIAPLAGTLTLGDFIISRNVYGDEGVLAGAILIALLAVAIEFSLAGVQYLLTPRAMRLSRSTSAA